MSAVTPAASVLLAHGPGAPEVLLVRRSEHLRFFGGFWAFPGGKVTAEDDAVPLTKVDAAWTAEHRRRCVTSVRETFEETGVLLARRADDAFPAGPELDAWRRELADDRLAFAELLTRERLTIHGGDFRLIGDITTSAFTTLRFDTTFFVAQLPPGQSATVWPGELTEGRWASAADMLDRWARGACLLSPPTAMTLQGIAGRPADDEPDRLGPLFRTLAAGAALHPIFFAPQVQLIPLHTASLPPSNYTNAFLVGHDPAYLLDPGPEDGAEQRRLVDLLDGRIREGLRLRAVVLTHQHRDHVGAATVCAERYGVPVWAHPLTAEKLNGKVAVARHLHDGDRLDLGQRPGGGAWHLKAVHTPGHAAGHLAFYEPFYRLLFAGDMVSTLTSIVIVPPEGDLETYLRSLRKLQGYDLRLLLPAHGNASSLPQKLLAEALEHRAKRERMLLAALGPTPRTLAELAPELYKGTPAAVLPLAERQMLANLLKLEREGKVTQAGEGWCRKGTK